MEIVFNKIKTNDKELTPFLTLSSLFEYSIEYRMFLQILFSLSPNFKPYWVNGYENIFTAVIKIK